MHDKASDIFRGFALTRIADQVGALKRELAKTSPLDRQQLLARLRDAEECLARLQQVPVVRRRSVVVSLVEPDATPSSPRLALLH